MNDHDKLIAEMARAKKLLIPQHSSALHLGKDLYQRTAARESQSRWMYSWPRGDALRFAGTKVIIDHEDTERCEVVVPK